jgi:hypothetical protein
MILAKDLLFIVRATNIRNKLRTLLLTLIPAMSLQLAGIGVSNAQPAGPQISPEKRVLLSAREAVRLFTGGVS